jgi:hypothetical protein
VAPCGAGCPRTGRKLKKRSGRALCSRQRRASEFDSFDTNGRGGNNTGLGMICLATSGIKGYENGELQQDVRDTNEHRPVHKHPAYYEARMAPGWRKSAVLVDMHMHGAVSAGAAPALRERFMIAHAFDAMTLLCMCSILRRVNRSCAAIVPARDCMLA